MRFWVSYTLIVIFLGIFFSLVYYIFNPYKSQSYASPVPDFLILENNAQVTLLDIWTPVFEILVSNDSKPVIEVKSALMYDLVRDRVVFEKNAHERLPMASLTKIMTAIIVLEDKSVPESFRVYAEDLVGEDSMGLTAGEILTKEELLYGLMLNSGNDAAEVIAHNYPGGREAFLESMQNKAKALGLQNTRFSNPSGLQGDGAQYTTTYDLVVMTKYALENFPLFRTVTATYEYSIPANSYHKEYFLTNETNLLSTYDGVKGIKTGYTPEAGMCLVTYYEKDGIRLIGVLLNSTDRRGQMRSLLDYSLHSLGVSPPPHD